MVLGETTRLFRGLNVGRQHRLPHGNPRSWVGWSDDFIGLVVEAAFDPSELTRFHHPLQRFID